MSAGAAVLERTVRFRARHHLRRHDWTDAENAAAFGPLADPAGHEHAYALTVRVAGPLRHGMVMDLVALDRLLAEEVVGRYAGRHLNVDLPAFGPAGTLPTCEAIAADAAGRLAARLPAGVALRTVRVAEDATLAGEWLAPA